MALLDAKFRRNKLRYVLQCLLAAVSVLAVLIILDAISNAAIIAAVGASSFIAFTMPHAQVSRPRFLIGGYVAGAGAGTACYWLSQLVWPALPYLPDRYGYAVFGAFAVGLAIFLMVVTNTEHPPAASLALGLVLGEWRVLSVVVVLVGIVVLAALKKALHSVMINLL
jgi:CBS-domain-containing membrane protein